MVEKIVKACRKVLGIAIIIVGVILPWQLDKLLSLGFFSLIALAFLTRLTLVLLGAVVYGLELRKQ